MNPLDPRTLRDARINDVFLESPSRLLLHLRDGRAVALSVDEDELRRGGRPVLRCEHVNPGGAA